LGKAWDVSSAIAFEKGLLPFWASWGCSGTASCKSEPRDKPTQVEMRLQAQIESCVKSCLSFSVFKKKVYRTKITFFFPKKAPPFTFATKANPSNNTCVSENCGENLPHART